MTGLLFPKTPKVQQPQPVPQVDEALKKWRDYDQITRRGAGATILTSDSGLGDLGSVNRKQAGGYG
jgi:hypothetical protein